MLFLLGVGEQRGRLPRPVVVKLRRCSSCSAWPGSAGGCLVRVWPSGVDALLLGVVVAAFVNLHFGRLDLDYLGVAVAAFGSLHHALFGERRYRSARSRLFGRRGVGVRVLAPRAFW